MREDSKIINMKWLNRVQQLHVKSTLLSQCGRLSDQKQPLDGYEKMENFTQSVVYHVIYLEEMALELAQQVRRTSGIYV